jgi:hypothetical protein
VIRENVRLFIGFMGLVLFVWGFGWAVTIAPAWAKVLLLMGAGVLLLWAYYGSGE